MKKIILSGVLCMIALFSTAQNQTKFRGYLYNDEYKVYIRMNFYDKNILVPGEELFGNIPGFFGAEVDSRKWLFTSTEIIDPNTATIDITDDYGSEDLTATLHFEADSTYTLTQLEGSTLKIAVNRKWVKMPKKLQFKRMLNRK